MSKKEKLHGKKRDKSMNCESVCIVREECLDVNIASDIAMNLGGKIHAIKQL